MSTAPVTIRATDRVAFVGKTGSGKTYAAARLLMNVDRLVVIDPKGTLRGKWGLSEWDARSQRALSKGRPLRVRVPAAIGDDGHWESVFSRCYAAGNVTVYVDEVYGVLSSAGARPGPWFTALYTRGRELGIGVWAATQRPAWIPLFILSESEWFFVFRLQMEADRDRMSGLVGASVDSLTGHSFYLYNAEWERPRFYRTIKEA